MNVLKRNCYSDRPVHRAPGIGHHDEEGHQRQVAKHQEQLGPGYAGAADPELGPADRREKAERSDVVEHVPIWIEDRQHQRDHREGDPARANGEQKALALAVGQRGLGKLLGFLLDLGPPVRAAAGIGDISNVCQYAQGPLLLGRSAHPMSPDAGHISSGGIRRGTAAAFSGPSMNWLGPRATNGVTGSKEARKCALEEF